MVFHFTALVDGRPDFFRSVLILKTSCFWEVLDLKRLILLLASKSWWSGNAKLVVILINLHIQRQIFPVSFVQNYSIKVAIEDCLFWGVLVWSSKCNGPITPEMDSYYIFTLNIFRNYGPDFYFFTEGLIQNFFSWNTWKKTSWFCSVHGKHDGTEMPKVFVIKTHLDFETPISSWLHPDFIFRDLNLEFSFCVIFLQWKLLFFSHLLDFWWNRQTRSFY